MIRRTSLAQWEFEFPFPGSLTSTFLYQAVKIIMREEGLRGFFRGVIPSYWVNFSPSVLLSSLELSDTQSL